MPQADTMSHQEVPSFVRGHIESPFMLLRWDLHDGPPSFNPRCSLRFPADGDTGAPAYVPCGFIPGERRPISMDLDYRNLLAPTNGPPLIPPSDLRSPRLTRPPSAGEFVQRSPDRGEMETVPPVTGKRRGGSRKACNECKQQKVSQLQTSF